MYYDLIVHVDDNDPKRVNLAFRIVPGGTHSEASWEQQIPIFMDCLGIE